MQKVCKTCGEEKPLDAFRVNKTKNWIFTTCRKCESRQSIERAKRNGKGDRTAEYQKRNAKRCPNAEAYSRAMLLARFKKQLNQLIKARTPAEPVAPWNQPGLTSRERYALKYKLNEEFRVSERLRRQITKRVKRDGIADLLRGALKRNGTSRQAERLLGYTVAELRQHLEKQFMKGMNWSNMGDWHIDHITPQAAFDMTDPEQFRACWCLSNLRPLWAAENIAKSDKQVYLL